MAFGDVCFCGRRKTGVPGEKPLEQHENQQQNQSTYGTGQESNPGQLVGGELSHLCTIPALCRHGSRILKWRVKWGGENQGKISNIISIFEG